MKESLVSYLSSSRPSLNSSSLSPPWISKNDIASSNYNPKWTAIFFLKPTWYSLSILSIIELNRLGGGGRTSFSLTTWRNNVYRGICIKHRKNICHNNSNEQFNIPVLKTPNFLILKGYKHSYLWRQIYSAYHE